VIHKHEGIGQTYVDKRIAQVLREIAKIGVDGSTAVTFRSIADKLDWGIPLDVEKEQS
jgi:hypothetical protein